MKKKEVVLIGSGSQFEAAPGAGLLETLPAIVAPYCQLTGAEALLEDMLASSRQYPTRFQ